LTNIEAVRFEVLSFRTAFLHGKAEPVCRWKNSELDNRIYINSPQEKDIIVIKEMERSIQQGGFHMKRGVKNAINILIIVAMLAANGVTMYVCKTQTSAQAQSASMGQSMEMKSGDSGAAPEKPDGDDSSAPSGDNASAEAQQPAAENADSSATPEKSDGDDSSAPSGDNASAEAQQPAAENADSSTPPEKPDSDDSSAPNGDNASAESQQPAAENADSSTPPEKPDGDDSSAPSGDNASAEAQQSMGSAAGSDSGAMPEKMDGNGGNTPSGKQNQGIDWLYYVLFGAEDLILALAVMYFVMSKANKKNRKETFRNGDKIVIYVLATILVTAVLTVGDGLAANQLTAGESKIEAMQMGGSSASDDAVGATEVAEKTTLSDTYTSSAEDESAILVKSGGKLTLSDATVTKTGDSSNTENSEFYGINSGILVTESAEATISGADISTDAKGSNAVFATGTDAKISISDSTITTTGESSARGLDATYGGSIEAERVAITTQGGSCAALATDRGEGTVSADDSTLETNGSGSPVIYSTGDISISNSKGTANRAQMVVVEGKNSATVENSTLVCSAEGNRNNVDDGGIMIYQSMSGDAGEGTGSFTAKDSSLTIDSDSDYCATAPMFFVTNTDAEISLENTTLSYGSGILLSAKGTGEWGNSGSNGGKVNFRADNQTLDGNIELDNLSSLDLSLTASNYQGTINADDSAESVSVTLDKDSEITLTGDSYITSLDNEDTTNSNIHLNGYTLYVNGTAIE
jgi:hypothetical protein